MSKLQKGSGKICYFAGRRVYDTTQDVEAASYEDAVVCKMCWKDIKKNSFVLKKIIKCI
jgi:hypothetical protein